MTQQRKVELYLMLNKQVSRNYAWDNFRITRLASIINRIKNEKDWRIKAKQIDNDYVYSL